MLPDALEHWGALQAALPPGPLAVFLDYDGTLTPTRARPQDAVLADSTRQAVARLAAHCRVAVVTGRGLADVRAQVGLPQLCYAANHGLEIAGPGLALEAEPELRPTLEALAPRVHALVRGIEGIEVEAKGLSISIHHRRASPSCVPALEAALDELLAELPRVRRATGKALIELRPVTDWHKGSAVRWLCTQWAAGGAAPVPLVLGDDRTDEDALAAVREDGVGIFVGRPRWPSAARFGLRDPAAVEELLRRLVDDGTATRR
ncbi:MAG: trehalose-phosphatase [Myxococcales bacterium]|nr:trehalose-phosphatase [Myxococcales bacterium]